jgi:hypothetical protein
MFCLVDKVDVDRLDGFSWYASIHSASLTAYASTNDRHGMRRMMHNIILPTDDGLEVDHVNGNGLDNRRKNLRAVTRAQQMCNKLKSNGMTSTYKGVFWSATMRKWGAVVQFGGQRTHAGYFDEEVDAAMAYDDAARDIHGAYARLNNPSTGEQSAHMRGAL